MLAGIISDFGSPTGAVPFAGRGEFDGVMTGAFRAPRVEGLFTGEDLRAFDTLWGSGSAQIVVENRYVNVKDGVVRAGDSEIRADGLFSLGYPREDRRRRDQRADPRRAARSRQPASRLRHRRVSGVRPAVGRVPPDRRLRAPRRLRRDDDQRRRRLRRAVSDRRPSPLRFDGKGVRLDNLNLAKDAGTITGAAFVGWDSTYSFNASGRRIPVERLAFVSVSARAALGPRRIHRQRQRHVRVAAQRLQVPRRRSVRRRGRRSAW